MAKIVTDNYMYAKVAKYVKSRKDLTEDMLEGLEEIVLDSSKAQAIMEASRMSMGKGVVAMSFVIFFLLCRNGYFSN